MLFGNDGQMFFDTIAWYGEARLGATRQSGSHDRGLSRSYETLFFPPPASLLWSRRRQILRLLRKRNSRIGRAATTGERNTTCCSTNWPRGGCLQWTYGKRFATPQRGKGIYGPQYALDPAGRADRL